MIIDTHSHVNFKAFDNDRDDLMKKTADDGVFMVNIGTNLTTSQKAIEISDKYKNAWASVGLHPIHLASDLQEDEDEEQTDEIDFDYQAYKLLAQNPKVVAIGEMGLDFYYLSKGDKKDIEIKNQFDLLEKELKLAKELNKAVVLHCRMAYAEMIKFFKDNKELIPNRAVLHCFMAPEFLNEFIDLGFYIGINGIIYKNIPEIDFKKMVESIPIDKIVLETDCPYLIHPSKKGERNTPSGVLDIAKTVSEWKNIPENELINIANQNAKKLFEIEF